MKIISIDAESDGLWGKAFSIAAIVYQDQVEIARFVARVPDEYVTHQWVIDNVLPTLDFPVTHNTREEMYQAFAAFYMSHKDAITLWHMGHVVEAFLFREMVRNDHLGEWDAPYTPIEVSEALRIAGENPSSVDDYVKKYGVKIGKYGTTHNPLYDCEVAAQVYFDLTK